MVNLFARQDVFGGPLPPPPPQSYLEEDQAPQMLAVGGVVFSLAMLCVVACCYVRVAMLKMFGVDGMSLPIFLMFRHH